jgi:hypothetical protein
LTQEQKEKKRLKQHQEHNSKRQASTSSIELTQEQKEKKRLEQHQEHNSKLVVVVGRVGWGNPQIFCNAPCLINLDSTTNPNQPEIRGRQTLPFFFFSLLWFSLDDVTRHDFL